METNEYSVAWWWFNFLIVLIPPSFFIVGFFKKPEDKSHTFFTWILYSAQDAILFFSGAEQRVYYDPLALGFVVGSLIMATILFVQKRFVSFGFIEILTLFLIIVCTVIWTTSGPANAQIASIISEAVIGIYLIIQTWRFPIVKYNIQGYLGFLLVSIITIILTKEWTFAEIGFAVTETCLDAIILIPLTKQWLKEKHGISQTN